MLDNNERINGYSQVSNSVIPVKVNTGKIVPNEKNALKENRSALDKVKGELVNNKKSFLIEEIKKAIVERIYYSDNKNQVNFSVYLASKLGYSFTYMSNVFAKIQGTNIRSFIIETKIERVKEMLIYDNLTLTEIAYKLDYSSVAHLSNQFKKVNGTGPSKYLAAIRKNTLPKMEGSSEVAMPIADQLQNAVVINDLGAEKVCPN
jgi:AraC-like DNA-binding protein